MIGARLRVLLLLMVLLGGAFALLVQISVVVLVDVEERLREERFMDMISASTYSLRGNVQADGDLEELALVMRQLVREPVWIVYRPDEDEEPSVEPARDARSLNKAQLTRWFAELTHEAPICEPTGYAGDGPVMCRVAVPGTGDQVMVVTVGELLLSDPSQHLRLIGGIAAVAWLFLGVGGYMAFALGFVRPLWRVVRAMERTGISNRARLELAGALEFQAIARAFNDMVRRQERARDHIRFQLEELQRAHGELKNTRDSLVRSEQLAQVGVLAAGVAHEVGNPMGIISGYADLLGEDDVTEEERRRYVSHMRGALTRIQGVLRNLLDFSRRDADDAPPDSAVRTVVEHVAELVRPQDSFRKKRISIDIYIEDGLPRVSMPAPRLEQVVLNLLINAADALDEGGEVRVRAERDGIPVRIRVEDNGPGIPAALAEHIFEPFVTTKEKGKGTGLGLFVCRHLVTAYGGEISAEPPEEGGTRFEIRLWPVGEES